MRLTGDCARGVTRDCVDGDWVDDSIAGGDALFAGVDLASDGTVTAADADTNSGGSETDPFTSGTLAGVENDLETDLGLGTTTGVEISSDCD